ncbi:hypothetical protein BDP55DRAFT_699135 [Colletotrichum godetiae]|uniref:Uncharacterized protein n=1 Tax=Colletotrichum godetiae TaxID=1209918 RepID=A0AAJ0EM92_9PEZI|nr:uncharacterized protein BDP55DRAFT_699135 [Colletotrichum godetiae]KAK1657196.1 hypothetical protein BDP55DRAFT_699135 [Colletotrichum godetiae]
MGRFIQLGALACLYLGVESKALRWQDDTPSWSPPRQTIAAMNMEELGFSPKPTAAPEPGNVELKLAKRVRGDDTCGYISGEATNSIYCGVGSCVINSFYSVVGCCSSSSVTDCTTIATSCLPSRSASRISSGDTRMQLCTSSDRPECATYIYSGSLFNRYTLYACAATEEVIVVYANPTDSSVTQESTSAPETTSVRNTASTTASSAATTSTSGGSGGGGGGSSTPIGAIVGGVVGGVAAIALIVFGIIFLLRKKKKDNNNNVNSNNQAAHQSYVGPPPPNQGQPQMYQQPAPPTQQPSPQGYPPQQQQGHYPQGFTPVDNNNRQSMLKQQYDVTTGSYDQSNNGVSPPASPPPMSPSPTYQSGVPQYVPSQNSVSPTQGTYPPQQQSQQQQQGGYYSAPPPAQGQPPAPVQQQQQHHQQPGFASELPAHRGDNELRELA